MKKIIYLVHFIFLILNFNAQDIQKMNKDELKDRITFKSNENDSLNIKISKIESHNAELNQNILVLKNEFDSLSKLNYKLEIDNQDLSKKQDFLQQKNSKIIRALDSLNKVIDENKNELQALQIELTNSNKTAPSYDDLSENDFLNQYFLNQKPLANNKFTLILSKVMYNSNERMYSTDYYSDGIGYITINSLPELLDFSSLAFWATKPNISVSEKKFNDLIFQTNSDQLNLQLPTLEFFENKLLTIKYKNSNEESFLFKTQKIENPYPTYSRKFLDIKLASEKVVNEFSENVKEDINWQIKAIGDESYLVLNLSQLYRLKIQILEAGIVYVSDPHEKGYGTVDCRNKNAQMPAYSDDVKTSNIGVYLSRKQDRFTDKSTFINPADLIFLFKLKEIE